MFTVLLLLGVFWHGSFAGLYSTGPDGEDDGARMTDDVWSRGFASTPADFDYDFTELRRPRD